MKSIFRVCSVTAVVLLIFVALGPLKWQPRSGFGWKIDDFAGYFVLTSMFCIAWARPFVVGGALMALAVLLEALQVLTPDRSSYLLGAFYSAGGVLAAALVAKLLI